MHWLKQQKKNKTGYAAAKLDMSKAYDRVEWDFLKSMMLAMRFPIHVVNLIMQCVSSVQFSFVINRKVYGSLTPSRGIRQGCPLSPFLFTICAQGLSSLLKSYEALNLFQGVKVAKRCPSITHLFFADDSLLFFKTEASGIKNFKQALSLYSSASGQEINYDKSTVSFSPCTARCEMDNVVRLLGIKKTQGHSCYLGLPTVILRNKRVQFDFLRDRISQKFSGWKNKFFSAGGKEVLIKSIIQSIPTYSMACFRIPESIFADIERLCANFWWGDTATGKSLHWATWDKLCLPKSKGGLGFRKLTAFNRALLAKQTWRLIHYPNSLIARVLRGRYYHSVDIMEAKVTSNASFTWRSICWGRGLIERGLRWKIGDGKSVIACRDAWIPGLITGMIDRVTPAYGDIKVSYFLSCDGSWSINKLHEVFLPHEIAGILAITPKAEGAPDTRYWKFDEKGSYNVKSGYLCATDYYTPHAYTSSNKAKSWWSCLWTLNIPPRVKIFGWKVVKNLIATDKNLQRHHVPNNGICFWCRKAWGSTVHCLVFCDKTRKLWKNTDFWIEVKGMEALTMEDICQSVYARFGADGVELWFVTLWSVWRYLCSVKHDGASEACEEVAGGSANFLKLFQEARCHLKLKQRLLPKEGSRLWFPPPKDVLRLDVDVSVNFDGRVAGVGFIIRNHEGSIIAAVARRIGFVETVLMGELHAMLLGIGFCLEHDLGPIHLFTDSLLATHVLNEECQGTDSLCDDLYDAFAHAKKYVVLEFSHARREANRAAHFLASYAVFSQDVMIWKTDFPSGLLDIVHLDLQ